MHKVTVICNVPHEIVEGMCALCQRDKALEDARRYQTLRAMVGTLNVEIGRVIGLDEHSFTKATPEDIRIALDAELDRKFCLMFGPPKSTQD